LHIRIHIPRSIETSRISRLRFRTAAPPPLPRIESAGEIDVAGEDLPDGGGVAHQAQPAVFDLISKGR
jgi:hypothetical protein